MELARFDYADQEMNPEDLFWGKRKHIMH